MRQPVNRREHLWRGNARAGIAALIVVDTSAILAVVLSEPEATRCFGTIARTPDILISAGTLAELLIVAGTRGVLDEVRTLVADAGFEIVSLSPEGAERVADAYRRWGKGIHPAGLNYGDCFAYALARDVGAALLFVGNDFSRTDIDPA